MKKWLKYTYILIISILFIPIKVTANSITLHKSQTTLGIGYSEILKYTTDEDIEINEIEWTSTDESVATVENGKVIALSEGTTIITAKVNGKNSTCKVTVVDNYTPVTSIVLNKSNINMLVDDVATIKATLSPAEATNQKVTWTSSNPSVATVDSSGNIKAISPGNATITASAASIEAKCEVVVTYSLSLSGISINKTELTIKERGTEQLSIIYNPTNATNKKVTWKSSNNDIVTVDANGKVTAIKAGNATITAVSNDGGYVATCKVTIEEISKKVESISLDKSNVTLEIGNQETLNVTINPDYAENKNIKWTTSDKKVATVENGVVTALSKGTVEIKAISEDGNKEASCKVVVTALPAKKIFFEKEEITAYIGTESELKLITSPEKSALDNPIWTSSNPKIATIENGIVKPLAKGETTITVTNKEASLTASIKVIVIEKPKEALNITIEGYNLNFNPNTKNYTLSISNESQLNININREDKYVNIKGNQNLNSGSIITITIDEEEKVTYIINIKKKQNYTIYFIAAISLLLLINLIRMMMKNKKKKDY